MDEVSADPTLSLSTMLNCYAFARQDQYQQPACLDVKASKNEGFFSSVVMHACNLLQNCKLPMLSFTNAKLIHFSLSSIVWMLWKGFQVTSCTISEESEFGGLQNGKLVAFMMSSNHTTLTCTNDKSKARPSLHLELHLE